VREHRRGACGRDGCRSTAVCSATKEYAIDGHKSYDAIDGQMAYDAIDGQVF
jgi:hypothetical protein